MEGSEWTKKHFPPENRQHMLDSGARPPTAWSKLYLDTSKDLAIALGEAKASGLSLPVTALVDQFYAQVQSQGGARQDTSALIRHLPEVSA